MADGPQTCFSRAFIRLLNAQGIPIFKSIDRKYTVSEDCDPLWDGCCWISERCLIFNFSFHIFLMLGQIMSQPNVRYIFVDDILFCKGHVAPEKPCPVCGSMINSN